MKSGLQKFSIIIIFLLLGASMNAKSQKVYTTQDITEAEIKIYVCANKNDADLVVYQCSNVNEAIGNNGLWFFCQYKTQTKNIIGFVSSPDEAKLKIYYTTVKTEAGWLNENKKYLLDMVPSSN